VNTCNYAGKRNGEAPRPTSSRKKIALEDQQIVTLDNEKKARKESIGLTFYRALNFSPNLLTHADDSQVRLPSFRHESYETRPAKRLLEPKKKTGGPADHLAPTDMTSSHIECGVHKKHYRKVDFKRPQTRGRRDKKGYSDEYDHRNRSARIALY